MVTILSEADTPVVTPSAASIDMVKFVQYLDLLFSTINFKLSSDAFSEVKHRQTIPLHSRIIKAI